MGNREIIIHKSLIFYRPELPACFHITRKGEYHMDPMETATTVERQLRERARYTHTTINGSLELLPHLQHEL